MLRNAFWRNQDLNQIVVTPDNLNIASINNVLFSKKDKRLVCYLSSIEGDSYTVPDGIQIIGSEAFYNAKLSQLKIPASVTTIEEGAFVGCGEALTLTVERESYAAQYCKENGLRYFYPDSFDWLNNQ